MTAFAPEVLALAWVRADGRCERCGEHLWWEERGTAWSAQHRRARGMGGSADPELGTVQNVAILCGSATTGCHGIVENTERAWAYAEGWALRMGMDAARVPIKHHQHGYVLLTEHGAYAPPREEES